MGSPVFWGGKEAVSAFPSLGWRCSSPSQLGSQRAGPHHHLVATKPSKIQPTKPSKIQPSRGASHKYEDSSSKGKQRRNEELLLLGKHHYEKRRTNIVSPQALSHQSWRGDEAKGNVSDVPGSSSAPKSFVLSPKPPDRAPSCRVLGFLGVPGGPGGPSALGLTLSGLLGVLGVPRLRD